MRDALDEMLKGVTISALFSFTARLVFDSSIDIRVSADHEIEFGRVVRRCTSPELDTLRGNTGFGDGAMW
jgi:hypothetical protein